MPDLALPAPIADLRELAYNLRWSWHAPTRRLFQRLDPARWLATGQNPVRLLAEIDGARLERAAADASYAEAVAAEAAGLRRYLRERRTWYAREHGEAERPAVAYFSAEFAVAECLKIFSGGLGVLAGDHLKSASDLGVPLVGVGLLYREGYFLQTVRGDGRQEEAYAASAFERLPLELERDDAGSPVEVTVPFPEREVRARVWRADVGSVPLYLLDTDVEANAPEDRRITDRLYGGDVEHRLRQEMVLGIGGVRALRALGLEPDVVHLNEGHAAFAAVERLRPGAGAGRGAFRDASQRGAAGVAFTTHTPVAAGHDYFAPDLLERYLGRYVWELGEPWDEFLALGRRDAGDAEEHFCMTLLALRLSGVRNGVSRLHGAVSREMWRAVWPGLPADEVPIGHVTNGVHLPTWVSSTMARVFTEHLGERWQDGADFGWHRATDIPLPAIWTARSEQRGRLVAHVRRALAAQEARRGRDAGAAAAALDPDALTIVFARRFATYKRATLLLSDRERLARLVNGVRPVQFVFAGKAHPRDEPAKEYLRQVFEAAGAPELAGRFIFLEGYDVGLARQLVQGADVWLNVPRRPHEASGTSGMKAAANGALNLSILDGWWAEAWVEHNHLDHPIGWAIGEDGSSAALETEAQDAADAAALYHLLEDEVVPLFYERDAHDLPAAWCERIRASVRQVNGFFNTHRMVREYVELSYRRDGRPAARAEERSAAGR